EFDGMAEGRRRFIGPLLAQHHHAEKHMRVGVLRLDFEGAPEACLRIGKAPRALAKLAERQMEQRMSGQGLRGALVMCFGLTPAAMLLEEPAEIDPWHGRMGRKVERAPQRRLGRTEFPALDEKRGQYR